MIIVRKYVSELLSMNVIRNYSVKSMPPSCERSSRSLWNLYFLFIISNRATVKVLLLNFYEAKYDLAISGRS
jgi:hypothetical protein